MPGRIIPLITAQIYHVFNRGVADQPVFLDKRDYRRAIETIFYYQNVSVPFRYSYLMRLTKNIRLEILNKARLKNDFVVNIIAYCLIPNHFHLLLRQKKDGGISNFMSNVWNSYTRYFNIKRERSGPVFKGAFNAVRIETENQLLHVSRYIHLNPYSSYVVKNLSKLVEYPYSSLPEYFNLREAGVCDRNLIMDYFGTVEDYKNFVFDQADYQRKLDEIKHLLIE